VHDQAFLLGVAVEACNRAQPTGNGCSSPPPRLELPAEALDVDTVHLKEAALMIRTPHRELSQVQRIRLTGGPSVTRQEPSERHCFTISDPPIYGHQSNRSSSRAHSGPPGLRRRPDAGATVPQPIQ
jgi:hypothetical protein